MAYRERIRRCCACRQLMAPLVIGIDGASVEIDGCEACGGVFAEYFDGEPAAIARALVPPGREADESDPPPEAICADCELPMSLHRYLGDGPALLRCGGCLAIFATPAMTSRLARYAMAREPATRPGLLATLEAWWTRRRRPMAE